MKETFARIFIVLFFSSCGKNSAYQYSQEIVKKEQSLAPFIMETERKIGAFLPAGQYDSIARVATDMEIMADKKVQEIIDEPAPKADGGDAIKRSSITYFTFIKNTYTGYKNFGNALPDSRATALQKLKDFIAQKQKVIQEAQAAQREFARKNF